MSKKAEIRHRLEGMEVDNKIPHDVTLSDEDRLIQVVYELQKRIESLESKDSLHHGTY